MARTPKNLAIGQLASTTLTTLYSVPLGINTTSSVLAFCNTSSTSIVIDIYHRDNVTATNYLQKSLVLPSGSGRDRVYYGFQRRVLNGNDEIKIQADSAAAFNYTFSGSEVEI